MIDPEGGTGRDATTTLLWLFGIFAASRLIVLVVAALVEPNIPMQPGGSASTAPILQSLTSGDGFWYVGIAASGYHLEPLKGAFHDYVFFPLWPFVIRIASFFTAGDLVVAGILAANVAFGLALIAFEHLSRPILGARGAVTAAAFLTFAPGGVAFAMIYSDSLFLLLSLAAVLAARRGAYPLMSLLFALAALTRLPGIVLVVPLAIVIGERQGWHVHRAWLWLASGPVALASFLGYLWWLTGDVLAYPRAQAIWNEPPDTYGPSGIPAIPTSLIVLALVVVVAIYLFQLVYLRASGIPRADVGYVVAGLVALALAVRIVSLPRYLAVLWPFSWLFTARRSQAFKAVALGFFVFAYAGFAFLDFTTLLAA
jgi:hypothetical protein